MRTLVISDLHLGNRGARDVLRRPAALERLLDTLSSVDRLVVLGDLAELVTRDPRRSLAVAEPVLRAIGDHLAATVPIVLVPGNHDWPLAGDWAHAQGHALGLAGTVPHDGSPWLERVTGWLGAARVSVSYPGVWLADGVYATHGHYLDDLLIPHAPVGLPLARPAVPAQDGPWVLEANYRRRLSRARRTRARSTSPNRLLLRALNPALPEALRAARLTAVTAAAVDLQMRRAALPALRTVLGRLAVPAHTVIFGHVHRLGPVAGDARRDWFDNDGPRLINTGSWIYERLLLDGARGAGPYWPGGAVLLGDGADARAVGLLDDLGRDVLWATGLGQSVA